MTSFVHAAPRSTPAGPQMMCLATSASRGRHGFRSAGLVLPIIALCEPMDRVKLGLDRFFQHEIRQVRQNLLDRAHAKRVIPVETGSVGFVATEMGMRGDKAAARFQGRRNLPADLFQDPLIVHEVQDFRADDQILFGRKFALNEIQNAKLHVLAVPTSLGCPFNGATGNIRCRQQTDLVCKLCCEYPFRAGELERSTNPLGNKAQCLLIFNLLVDREIVPRVRAFKNAFPIFLFRCDFRQNRQRVCRFGRRVARLGNWPGEFPLIE